MNNLFIVGAQRSGSTYLYNLLDGHPEVSMIRPARPEPKFFLSQDSILQGKSFYEDHFFLSRNQILSISEKKAHHI